MKHREVVRHGSNPSPEADPPAVAEDTPAVTALGLDTRGVGSLDHIRWVGGDTGAGKTTVTRRLSERFGLPVYSSDATIGVHAARLSEAAAP